jgi:hypothetical protein
MYCAVDKAKGKTEMVQDGGSRRGLRIKRLFHLTKEGRLHDETVQDYLAMHQHHNVNLPKSKINATKRTSCDSQQGSDSTQDRDHDPISQAYELDKDRHGRSKEVFLSGYQIETRQTVPGRPDPRTDIPDWGSQESIVLAFLAYRYPAYETKPRARKAFMRDFDTISVVWWGKTPAKDSQLSHDTEVAIRKRLERLRKDGNKVIVKSEKGSWRLTDRALKSATGKQPPLWKRFDNNDGEGTRHFLWGLSERQFANMLMMALRSEAIQVPSSGEFLKAIRNVRRRPFHESLELAAQALETDPDVAIVLPAKFIAGRSRLTNFFRSLASRVVLHRLQTRKTQNI